MDLLSIIFVCDTIRDDNIHIDVRQQSPMQLEGFSDTWACSRKFFCIGMCRRGLQNWNMRRDRLGKEESGL